VLHKQGLADFEAPTWFAVFLPRGALELINRKLNQAAIATVDTPSPANGSRDENCHRDALAVSLAGCAHEEPASVTPPVTESARRQHPLAFRF
jgi:hypothetical protein